MYSDIINIDSDIEKIDSDIINIDSDIEKKFRNIHINSDICHHSVNPFTPVFLKWILPPLNSDICTIVNMGVSKNGKQGLLCLLRLVNPYYYVKYCIIEYFMFTLHSPNTNLVHLSRQKRAK